MNNIHDLHVKNMVPLISPKDLKEDTPSNEKVNETVVSAREAIKNILDKKDKRLLVIAGPCSIHDEESSIEYAIKLNKLREKEIIRSS